MAKAALTNSQREDAQAEIAPPTDPSTLTNGDVRWLTVRGAAHNNLKSIDIGIPLGRFVCVTGVSGSGKSSFVNDILYEALARKLNGATTAQPGKHDRIDGLEHLDKVIAIDQSPIGRTPRSNPATYIKVFDEIRELFTKLPDSKLRGYKPGRFSFNVEAGRRGGGRCEACEGNGSNRIEMDFLADVWVTCPICEGKRFGRETLQIHYKEKSISDVLQMDVQDALAYFENIPRIRGMCQTLHDVGLDYIKLGQSSTTLSGGEAQRIKLARELVKKPTGRTLYILDEPTTGLHFEDIRRLLVVLHGFVDAGNTVVVIEHNMEVLKTADWLIDLGPEGGQAGGRIVAEGTPEEVAACEASHTGQALREMLGTSAERSTLNAEKARIAGAAALQRTDFNVQRSDEIRVVGARQHNLKDLTVSFPRNRTTVCTGLSGSGKTSFAIDTIYTEGHRRYVESLSAYARQFLGQMAKPRVDHVYGLSPAICIEQKAASKSPRSTVGTITEVYDYMRVLWARVGTPYCYRCNIPVGSQTIDEIVDRIMSLRAGTPIILLAPLSLGDGETYTTFFQRLKSSGYTRVRIDGVIQETATSNTLDARRKHRVEIVVDRAVVQPRTRARVSESVEHALALSNGLLIVLQEEVETVETDEHGTLTSTERSPSREQLFSQRFACVKCGNSYSELSPHFFSFNSPLGWCETCEGLGIQRGAPASEIIVNPSATLLDGAIAGWESIERGSAMGRMLAALCKHIGADVDAPVAEWSDKHKRVLMFGSGGEWVEAPRAHAGGSSFSGMRFQWKGFFPAIDDATRNSWMLRHKMQNLVAEIPCIACRGGRLRRDAAAARFGGKTIVEVCEMPLSECEAFFQNLQLDAAQRRVAGELLKEIENRLSFLINVGLDYVTLHRSAPTLSGGESQRIRLAGQIGTGLSGVLYVLDEPTIGLHPRDTGRLVKALESLRNLGNTLLMVEHDRDVIRSADRVLDFGPGAGRHGGHIVDVFADGLWQNGNPDAGPTDDNHGSPQDNSDSTKTKSLTRAYLEGTSAIPVPTNRRPVPAWLDPANLAGEIIAKRSRRTHFKLETRNSKLVAQPSGEHALAVADSELDWLVIRGARQNNLKNVDVPIPLARLVCITGVSGSGKSSLVNDILWPALSGQLQRSTATPGEHDRIEGIEHIDKAINVDQSPIGTTPSSNPSTYTGTFDWIRELFARLPDSKVRGYSAQRFSFNRPGGRCEACEGYGQKCIEMHFLPDVWVECETCRGKRYNPETLEVRYKGKSIADVLEMSVADAVELFKNVPKVRRMLETLADVGLDYVQLGQPAPTLSGGEAQRVKLATELGKPNTGQTVYILDEPTTGLHFDDVRKLLDVLQRLVDLGNSVIVVEHNLDVLKSADWIIDLGPEAGDKGGYVVAAGTPEKVTSTASKNISHTAIALRPILAAGPHTARKIYDPAAHAALEMEIDRSRLIPDTGDNDTRMPWEIDGENWHLRQRTSRDGKPVRWEPAALRLAVDLICAESPDLSDNWSDRARVEIDMAGSQTWFFHALTGSEWLLDFTFRVPRGVFEQRALAKYLGLKTLDQRDDLPIYGRNARVHCRRMRWGFDSIRILVHDKTEIDTPAFRQFIKKAAKAYVERVNAGASYQPSSPQSEGPIGRTVNRDELFAAIEKSGARIDPATLRVLKRALAQKPSEQINLATLQELKQTLTEKLARPAARGRKQKPAPVQFDDDASPGGDDE